jgi:hypothetical protein
MTTRRLIDRKTFLTSSVATLGTMTLGGCGDEQAAGGGTGGRGPTHASGGGVGLSGGSAQAGAGASAGGTSKAGTGGTSKAGMGGTSDAGMGGASDAGMGGASDAGMGGASDAGMGGASDAGMGGASDAGMGGLDGAGAGGMEGNALVCTADTDNGMHAHPLTVPGSHVDRGYPDDSYLLEDGGTGHTHRLILTAYDFVYLRAGVSRERESSEEAGHVHTCVITCAPG